LGTKIEEDAASLLELKPTLIIGSVPFKTETVQEILKLPVPFLALNPRSLTDVEMDIRTLGLLADAKQRAEALIREMRGRFGRIRKTASRAKSRPRVYCEAWPNPRISSPPWVAELVEICSGKMAVPAGARVSDADVARANPEIIVLAWTAVGGKSKPEQALNNPAWAEVRAVRDKKIFVIRDEMLNTPGPPLVRGAEELLRVIHPELASSKPNRRSPAKARIS
jgi:iron complex transport system substrate-binding protein